MVFFRKSFAKQTTGTARGKSGARAYAVGDIHGRLDLLERMLHLIDSDRASLDERRTFIIFLGDFIDRGPDSAGVIERLRTYRPDGATTVMLGGNHEEVLLRILQGEKGILPSWLKFGGAECAESYGIDPVELGRMREAAAIDTVRAKVPAEHREFLEHLSDTFSFGDYLFVHAGIRPGIDLEEQSLSDLRWIREPFLSDQKAHPFMVIHGHTICAEVDERPNRIGIDTGAYHTGRLTALVVEDHSRRYLVAGDAEADNA